ncbi:hypothetical protein HNR23_002284 [Nocardiopsis mwathae]|uniref:Type II toxin-antitoxin system HicA family toxin n=1 Tax=Nocardiopsis mwathae TaxID=1472723 RepID=A0A7W9YHF9_9ACTN|nr:hypothetical protein [Nocardiopsis mwathae]MBB6172224.1 hypothetical protein [Nocardiopsis mwathae]
MTARVPREYRALYRAARNAGWRVVRRPGSQHWAWYPPGSRRPVITASSPSCSRTWLNDRARLRQAGLRGG